MKKKANHSFILSLLAMAGLLTSCNPTTTWDSLVPDTPSKAPDYFCTWNIQGYVADYNGPRTEALMNEQMMFGDGQYEGWTRFFPQIRQDLLFVMDDSWDVPFFDESQPAQRQMMGEARLSTERFPSFQGEPAERLKALVDSVEALGWKGLGGWICAQKPLSYSDIPEEEYWAERFTEAKEAGMVYWKVDFGREENNNDWRRMLTETGWQYAPGMIVEHAYGYDCCEFSDAFRTYDVENITAQPVTIARVARLLPHSKEPNAMGLINCEDEPYIAAGLGCAIGVMRHPFTGPLPCGLQDHVFPPTNRDLKHRLDEVARGVRWHRLALPFGVADDCEVDTVLLEDNWIVGERETWVPDHHVGDTLRESAPARVSRGMPLPKVDDTASDRPYVLASRYPNGATAVAAIGRALGRQYVSKPVAVTIDMADPQAPIGIFGYFSKLTLRLPDSGLPRHAVILAQDLAGDTPIDITRQCHKKKGSIVLPGKVLTKVGLMAASADDVSDPAIVVKIVSAK